MNSKDRIIENIAHRIRDEFRKHESLDWALIAAKKIYSSYNISLIDDADLRNKYPANVEGSNEFNLTNNAEDIEYVRNRILTVLGVDKTLFDFDSENEEDEK
jgi:hypothetical protein